MTSAEQAGAQSVDPAYQRYTRVAILLHWGIAILIFAQLGAGFLLLGGVADIAEDERQMVFDVIQWHKAVGLTVLALSVARLVWRLWRPAPPLPEGTPGWQRAVSGVSHAALYALMIGLPLTGWAMVSTSPDFSSLPTTFFGLFFVPHLPVVALIGDGARAAAAALFSDAHLAMAWGAVALLALHVAAAFKHHVMDRDPILARITPGLQSAGGPLAPPTARSGGAGKLTAASVALAAGAGAAAVFAPAVLAPSNDAAIEAAMIDDMAAAPSAGAREAAIWTVDPAASALSFGGAYVMGAYSARFEDWTAAIAFDPAALEASSIRAVINTASARSGSSQIDGAMREQTYFHSGEHPTAVFQSDRILAGEGQGAYVAEGTLSLRGVAAPIRMPFTLEIDGDQARADAVVTVQRLDFGVGPEIGGDGGVDPAVEIRIEILARRARPGG